MRKVVGVIESVRVSLTREAAGKIYVPVTAPDRWASVVAWAPGLSDADLKARIGPTLSTVIPGARVYCAHDESSSAPGEAEIPRSPATELATPRASVWLMVSSNAHARVRYSPRWALAATSGAGRSRERCRRRRASCSD